MLGVLLALAVALAGGAAWAQTNPFERTPAQQLDVWDRAAAAVEEDLKNDALTADAIAVLRAAMETQRAAARALADQMRSELAPLEAQEQALGPPPAEEAVAEAPEITERRKRLATQRAEVDGRLRAAELAATRADTLIARLIERQRTILTDRLLGQGPSLFEWQTWRRGGAGMLALTEAAGQSAVDVLEGALNSPRLPRLIIGLLLIAAFWRFAQPRLREWVDTLIDGVSEVEQPQTAMLYALALVLVRATPPTLTAYALAFLLKNNVGLSGAVETFVWGGAQAVFIIAIAYSLARILFAPRAPSQRIMPLDDAGAAAGARQALALAGLVAGARWLFDTAVEAEAPVETLALFSALVAFLAAPILYRLNRSLTPRPADAHAEGDAGTDEEGDEDFDLRRSLAAIGRFVGVAIAVGIPAAAALDYFALSQFLLERGALTAALFACFGLLFIIALRLLYGHSGGGEEEAEAPAAPTGMAAAAARPSAALGLALVGLSLAALAAPALAYIWGASLDELRLAGEALLEGVRVGEVEFSFGVALQAIAVVVAGVWLTRVLQRIVRRNVLPSTRLDKGAQNSVSAALGYLGVFLTAALAISTTGLDLSNLAIVAGALSVGIGFGLQNVVNNFVSGLILLVERPIQVGDWIIVGGAEGYVRRINVRSTEIETFDRASVIVPNSDLISSQVTNWTHKNLTGRVICKVGVAYDSDVDQVASILRGVAAGHPMALRYPAPAVLFRGFGDSALDFELRLFIRDVNWVLSVHSELNFEIFRQFREAGVEIPFPQRDLHLKSAAPASATNGLYPAAPAPAAARPPEAVDLVKGEAEGGDGGDGGR